MDKLSRHYTLYYSAARRVHTAYFFKNALALPLEIW